VCEKLALVLASKIVVLGSDCRLRFVAVVVRELMLTRSVESRSAEVLKVDGGRNMEYRTQDTEYRIQRYQARVGTGVKGNLVAAKSVSTVGMEYGVFLLQEQRRRWKSDVTGFD
jgi:hypothetical protein